MSHPLEGLIGLQSNWFSDISKELSLGAYISYQLLLLSPLQPFVIQTRHLILMIEDQHQVLVFSLDQIWSLGGLRSNRWWLVLVLKQNIEILPWWLLKCPGFNLSFLNLQSSTLCLLFTVITWALLLLLVILFFMLGLNTWNLFFVGEKMLSKLLQVVYVPAINQYVDFLPRLCLLPTLSCIEPSSQSVIPQLRLRITHHELAGEY